MEKLLQALVVHSSQGPLGQTHNRRSRGNHSRQAQSQALVGSLRDEADSVAFRRRSTAVFSILRGGPRWWSGGPEITVKIR